MKKLVLLCFLVLAFSCSKDDDTATTDSPFPKTTTMKFEVDLTEVRDANITTTINDVEVLELSSTANFSKSYENIVVSLQTVFKLKYEDLSPVPFQPYEATMKILDIDNVVKSQNFNVTEQGQILEIEYMFSEDN